MTRCIRKLTQRVRIFRRRMERADEGHWAALQVLRRWRRRIERSQYEQVP